MAFPHEGDLCKVLPQAHYQAFIRCFPWNTEAIFPQQTFSRTRTQVSARAGRGE
jgi:hypothetical protein